MPFTMDCCDGATMATTVVLLCIDDKTEMREKKGYKYIEEEHSCYQQEVTMMMFEMTIYLSLMMTTKRGMYVIFSSVDNQQEAG